MIQGEKHMYIIMEFTVKNSHHDRLIKVNYPIEQL